MNFQEIQNIFDQKLFHVSNPYLNKIIQKFKFLLISEEYQTSIQNLRRKNKYSIIVIGEYINSQNECNIPNFFIVCFDNTLLLIPSTDFSLLFSLFEINPESIICCTSGNVKKKIEQSGNQKIHFQFSEENDRLLIEKLTTSFLTKFELDFSNVTSEAIKTIKFTWNIISKSVSFFMIKIGFLNSKFDRNIHFDDYLKSGVEDKELVSDEFIQLNLYNRGSSSSIYLAYLIEKEEICLMKMFLKTSEEEKLFQREHENYLSIKHPLHPRYFGTTKYLSYNCLFIEYLEGRTLNEIDFAKESTKDIMKIIFEIMIILSYLHHNGFVYRDLKPNNVIVDKNYTVYLIDFDRMIKSSSLKSNQNMTDNFCDGYMAPEILNGESFTYKSDIYSLGKVILFILSKSYSQELIKIQQMFSKCISSKEDERPSLSQLIKAFHIEFFFIVFMIDDILKEINYESDISTFYLFMIAEYQNANTQSLLAFFYLEGYVLCRDEFNKTEYTYSEKNLRRAQLIPQNTNKAIFYYTLAANQNNSDAQFILGVIYYNGKYITKNINKAIHYYTLAASQNNSNAQFNLGVIYYEGKYVTRDINKAIYFYTIAANQNHSYAQLNLGLTYLEGKYVTKDINKAIHYFTLAANQNHSYAQLNLGVIYYEGKYVTKDINKTIHYYTLAANQNNSDAQFHLGLIYEEGKYNTRDINKAIHYYTLAANQNNSYAQFHLGFIYLEGKYITRDINKAIKYYTLAANQNNSYAQFSLGLIYIEGKYITRDINKAIKYYTLAANQNNSYAQFNLGLIYLDGKYVARDINKVIHYFTLAANQNNSDAQFHLGLIFLDGKYVTRDINKAIHYYTLAADQNHSNAQLYLGLIYEEGKYITRDINKAIHYYTLAANQNNSYAQFHLGFIYLDGKYVARDINKAIKFYTLAANQNNSYAQFHLGFIYLEGKYITRDINKAIKYYTLAANQNNSYAQFSLGLIYIEGKYITRDINKAIKYYTLAANQNNSYAQFNLGLIYLDGKYITRDINKAIHYYTLAANQNNSDAQFHLGFIYLDGKYVARDINKAIHCFTLSANQNNSDAQFHLGLIYLDGKYVARDINKVIHYFTLAANQNNSDAQFHLGLIFLEGKYVTRDINKAIHYYTLAADQNHSNAQLYLGLIYEEGKYIIRDINKAIHYYTLAANQNNSYAQWYLGFIYQNGEYVTRDINKAIHYYTLAANQNNSYAQFSLGVIYFNYKTVPGYIKKGIYLITLSAINGCIKSNFHVGFFNHEGVYMKRDINKAIHYYKEASSFNNQYAKNNLGIIFKKGYKDEVAKNLGLSIEYFKEAIRQKNDEVSMYNLAHLYFYEDPIKDSIDKSIELLIRSLENGFHSSKKLLCLVLIKKCNFDLYTIKEEIERISHGNKELSFEIYTAILNSELLDSKYFETNYEYYRDIDFLYKNNLKPFRSVLIEYDWEMISKPKIPNISKLFYEGFGFEV